MNSALHKNSKDFVSNGFFNASSRRCRSQYVKRTPVYTGEFFPKFFLSSSLLVGKQKNKQKQKQFAQRQQLDNFYYKKKGRRVVPIFSTCVRKRTTYRVPCGKRRIELHSTRCLRIKGKQKDPSAPFNHRSRFSKLKRSINELRKKVFESIIAQNGHHYCFRSTCNNENYNDRGDNNDDDDDYESCDDGDDFPTFSPHLQNMWCCVKLLEKTYSELHCAMRERNYKNAGKYINYIKELKRALSLATFKWRLIGMKTNTVKHVNDIRTKVKYPFVKELSKENRELSFCDFLKGEDDIKKNTSVVVLTDEPNYVNFYPSMTEMGIFCHPLTELIDRRRKRYPQRLNVEEIAKLNKNKEEDIKKEDIYKKKHIANCKHNSFGKKYVGLYCVNIITDGLDDLVFTILQRQYHLQSRMKKEKPLHFKARRLYTTGLREVLKVLRAVSTRIPVFVFLAADIEVTTAECFEGIRNDNNNNNTGVFNGGGNVNIKMRRTIQEMGISGALAEIRTLCQLHNIPLITCMSRRRLAYAVFAKGCAVACVLLHSADGVYEEAKALRNYAQFLFDEFNKCSQQQKEA